MDARAKYVSAARRGLKILYFVWLAGFLVLYARQHAVSSSLVVVVTLLLLGGFLVRRDRIRPAVERVHLSPCVKFVGLATGSALLVETLYIFTPDPIHPNLLMDWLLEAPLYTAIYASWWFILRRYRFTLWELFFLGGIVGALVEANVQILANPLGILLVPHAIAVHGAMIVPAAYLVQQDLEASGRSNSRWRFVLALIPAVWVIPFLIIWLPLLSH